MRHHVACRVIIDTLLDSLLIFLHSHLLRGQVVVDVVALLVLSLPLAHVVFH